MAMPSSIRKGQFPVFCDLCETEKKISCKCLDCDLLMCNSCRDGRHLKIKNAKNHKVIDIKEIGSQPAKLDFRSIPCSEHQGQSCVMYCKSCDMLVCPLCMAKVHNGHQFVEISEGYEIQIQKLLDRQNEMEIKSKAQVTDNKIKEITKAENAKYLEVKKKIKAQNLALKRSIDQHTEELLKEVDRRWKTFNSSIEKDENRIRAIHNTSTNTQLDDIIISNDAEKIFQKIEELEKTLQEAEDSMEIKFTSMPIFIPGEIIQYNIGSLQDTTDIKIRLVQEYTTDSSKVFNMSPCVAQDVDSMWISNQDVVQKVKPEGNNLKTISSHNIKVYDMALTPSNDLLLVSDGSVIKQISGSTGQLGDSIYRTDPLDPISIHVTPDYKVLIGVKNKGKSFPVTGRRAVISMDKDGKNKTFYEHDIYNKSILSYPKRITTTQTGNICVVDKLSSDGIGRVVVLSQEGGVITTYTGHPTINSATKPFKPVYIQTTPADNIIVTDLNTEVLHILNNAGHIITHINTTNIGIESPYSIAFTAKGKMYIGCSRDKGSTAMAKLCEVKLSE